MNSIRHLSEPVWMLCLGVLVVVSSLLFSNGRFQSVDESAMFVAAHNLVSEGTPHTNQMGYSLWALRPGEAVNSLAADGNLYTKKSPVMILLLTPLIAFAQFAGLETVRVALALGPILLGGTAVLLYSLARQLSYQRGTATLTTLIFAFATLALPYSQTIFGEMVAMFGLMLALWSFARIDPHPNPPPDRGRGLAPSPFKGEGWGEGLFAFLCGLGIALAIGVNAVYAVVALLFGLFLTWPRLNQPPRWIQSIKTLLWFALPIVLLGIGLLAYNQIRFDNWFTTGYNFAPGQEGFTTPLWWGMAGLLISPARGLLWYSFPVILGLIGLPAFYKRETNPEARTAINGAPSSRWYHADKMSALLFSGQKGLTYLMLAVIAVQVVAFSLWWEWWGGYGWGPRFLLPLVPYLMVFALPFVETATLTSSVTSVRGNRLARAVIVGVSLLGVLVQVAGMTVDANRYEQALDANFPAPTDAPLRYHHDPALVYEAGASPIINQWQQLLAGEADNIVWLRSPAPPQLTEITAVIQSQQQPGDALIFFEPDLLYEVLAADLPPAYGLPYNIDSTDELAHTLFTAAVGEAKRIWLITWYAPGDPANWYEAELREEWASVSDEWLGEYRLILLARPPAPLTSTGSVSGAEDAVITPENIQFGSITLVGSQVAPTKDTLFVTLAWQAAEPLTKDYVAFVHLVDADGNLIAQQDRPPLAGYRPTSSWAAGEPVVDRFAFVLSPEQMAEARVRVGWYAWPSLERLTWGDGADAYELR